MGLPRFPVCHALPDPGRYVRDTDHLHAGSFDPFRWGENLAYPESARSPYRE
jgi:hypothetical protein